MACIYLIRHCESEGNAARRAHAQTDSLVTRKGYRQAEILKDRFSDIKIDAAYASDMYRSIMTAKPVADAHGIDVKVRFGLREVTTGIWEDESWGNIAEEYPELCDRWMNRPWLADTPGATSFQQVADRILFCLRRIAREIGPDGSAIVVTHSCSIKAALCAALGRPMTEVLTLGHGENTSVSRLLIDEDGTITVDYMNDASHLPAELRRAWQGLAGSSVNMPVYPCRGAEGMEQLLMLEEKRCASHDLPFDAVSFRREAEAALMEDPASIALGYLEGKPCGYVRYAVNAEGIGELQELFMLPELCGKGYGEQLFGYVLHELRYADRNAVIIRSGIEEEGFWMTERFVFESIEEGVYLLKLFTPLYNNYHVLP